MIYDFVFCCIFYLIYFLTFFYKYRYFGMKKIVDNPLNFPSSYQNTI